MQIIDKKAKGAGFFHPSQLLNHFVVCKMMTEEGRKNNIRLLVKLYQPVIRPDKRNAIIPFLPTGIGDAFLVDIDSREFYRQLDIGCPFFNGS